MKTAFAVYNSYAFFDDGEPEIKTVFSCLCKTRAAAERRRDNYNRGSADEMYFVVEVALLRLTLDGFWFDKIEAGLKRHECRIVKDYWNKRIGSLCHTYLPGMVLFTRGYTNRMLLADITDIQIINGLDSDLHINKDVLMAIFRQLNIKGVAKWNKL